MRHTGTLFAKAYISVYKTPPEAAGPRDSIGDARRRSFRLPASTTPHFRSASL